MSSKGIINSKDWHPTPEQEYRARMGLDNRGAIVDLGRYLGQELEPIVETDQPLRQKLLKWATKHSKFVRFHDDRAWFYSRRYELEIRIVSRRRNRTTHWGYVGTLILRYNGQPVFQTDLCDNIGTVLSDFRTHIEHHKDDRDR